MPEPWRDSSAGTTIDLWHGGEISECRQRLIAVAIRSLFVVWGTAGINMQILRK